MVTFESAFDIGDAVQHYLTKERFFVRFITFGAQGEPTYACYPSRYVGRTNEQYTFDEAELELIEE